MVVHCFSWLPCEIKTIVKLRSKTICSKSNNVRLSYCFDSLFAPCVSFANHNTCHVHENILVYTRNAVETRNFQTRQLSIVPSHYRAPISNCKENILVPIVKISHQGSIVTSKSYGSAVSNPESMLSYHFSFLIHLEPQPEAQTLPTDPGSWTKSYEDFPGGEAPSEAIVIRGSLCCVTTLIRRVWHGKSGSVPPAVTPIHSAPRLCPNFSLLCRGPKRNRCSTSLNIALELLPKYWKIKFKAAQNRFSMM